MIREKRGERRRADSGEDDKTKDNLSQTFLQPFSAIFGWQEKDNTRQENKSAESRREGQKGDEKRKEENEGEEEDKREARREDKRREEKRREKVIREPFPKPFSSLRRIAREGQGRDNAGREVTQR